MNQSQPRTAHVLSALALFACIVCVSADAGIGRDTNGWTTFAPSPDSRIIYVSSSTGDDATATWYAPNDGAIGDDPFSPTGQVNAYATLASAFTAARDGYPDWVLLKRGDVFFDKFATRSGRAADERFLYSAYGDSGPRPLLKLSGGAWNCGGGASNVAIVSIDAYAYKRDPASPDYAGAEGGSLFTLGTGGGTGTNVISILLEDCLARFGNGNIVFQERNGGVALDVVVRRCVILDSYSTNSHAQGMFAYGISVLLEENFFDHNGWLVQAGSGTGTAQGAATVFNHNTYFSHCHDCTFRGNIFLRSSSIQNKWTGDVDFKAPNHTMVNNLYVDGEIGISIGGNNPGPYRFPNVTIVSNVFTDIGLSRPTGRTLSTGIGGNDWDGGLIADNLLLHQTNTVVKNMRAISFGGAASSNVSVRNNLMYNLLGRYAIRLSDSVSNAHVVFAGNRVQLPELTTTTVSTDGELPAIEFRDSTYYTDRDADDWFTLNGAGMGFTNWQAAADEPSAVAHKLVFPDATRTLQTYMSSIGETGTYEAFIAAVRSRSKFNWRPELTADAINAYFRAGLATLDVATTGLPTAVVGQLYNTALQAVNASGAVYWTLHAGALPAGLSVSSNGVISGTPQAVLVDGEAANGFTVLAHDTVNLDPQTLAIVVVPEPLVAAMALAVVCALLAAVRRE